MHTLVQRRLDNEALQGSLEELDAFWRAVGEEGTPLLTQLEGGDFNATFVYRTDVDDPSVITQVLIMWDGDAWPETAYWVDSLALRRMGRTDIWYGDVDLPDDFCGMYYVALANENGIINEDVHEPWPMSFCDELNQEPTREPDAIYPRNIVRTPKPNASPNIPRGTAMELSVDAAHLRLGRKLWRRSGREIVRPPAPEYPVWTYLPADWRTDSSDGPSQALPVVVLLSGQFLEVADLKDVLDRSIDQGLIPPLAVVAPGRTTHGHNSWGYRRGFGPPDKATFLRESLWPLLRDSLDVRGPMHLVAWGQDAPAALRTAAGTRDLVGSLTLLNPILKTLGGEDDEEEGVRRAVGEDLRGFDVVVGVPATRSGVFTWSDTAAKARVLYDLSQAGVSMHRVVQSDPNIISEIDTMIRGVALMVSS